MKSKYMGVDSKFYDGMHKNAHILFIPCEYRTKEIPDSWKMQLTGDHFIPYTNPDTWWFH